MKIFKVTVNVFLGVLNALIALCTVFLNVLFGATISEHSLVISHYSPLLWTNLLTRFYCILI